MTHEASLVLAGATGASRRSTEAARIDLARADSRPRAATRIRGPGRHSLSARQPLPYFINKSIGKVR
jgi:hypothetical protein